MEEHRIATANQIGIALQKLASYVPVSAPPDATLALYAAELRGVRYDRLLAGFTKLKSRKFYPSLGEILDACGIRVPDDEAEEAICVNLAVYLLHRTPMSRAASAVFHRYGGLDGFVGLEAARDPVEFVRPKVAAAIRNGMVFSLDDITPPPAPLALPPVAAPLPVGQPITQEQRKILASAIGGLARAFRNGRKPPPPEVLLAGGEEEIQDRAG